MGLLSRPSYDRRKLLDQARAAQKKGRIKKAIRLYQRVLEAEPQDPDIHRKLAPLLARTRQENAALASFGEAVSGLMKRGMEDKAIGVCHETVQFFPKRADVWEAIARLELDRKRTPDAVKALRSGRAHCTGRRGRADALRLLRRAHAISPNDLEIATDLARLLRRSGARAEARNLLAGLGARVPRNQLRRVRWAQLCVDKTPHRVFAWLRALVGR
jgi:tetratricopeptide (TPR) repeat protein